MTTTTRTRRAAALATGVLLALSAGGCDGDASDDVDAIESNVEQGVDDAGEVIEDAGEELQDED